MGRQGQTRAPLEGIVVIDLTRVLSGPYATMLLGDLGATILKIENPNGGDTTRHSAPFRNGQSHYFLAVNRNKHSIAIDLSTPEGGALLRRLCQKADVLIENFRPGALQRIGLTVESLQAQNPRLVVCSISGFGQSGPLRDRIAYDVIAQAMSGVLSTNGDPQGAPVRISVPVGDLTGGFLSVIGVLSAIIGRDRGDAARHVDVSLYDGLISSLGYMASLYDVSGEAPARTGSRHPSIVPYGTFRTKDGWLALAIFTTPFWRKFCEASGRPELATDARFRRTQDRMTNRASLEPMVETIIAERSTAEWEAIFAEADVPASAILSIPEAVEHEHARYRGMFPTLTHEAYGAMRVPGPPLQLGGEAISHPKPPPLLGEDTACVLERFLGLNEEEISDLERRGIVRASEAATEAAR